MSNELLEITKTILGIVREGSPEFQHEHHLAMHAARGDDDYEHCPTCQATLVQDALRAGQKVAVMAMRSDLIERAFKSFIPEDLPIAARHQHLRIRFKNGACLAFIPAWHNGSARGIRWDLALYLLLPREMMPIHEREREQDTWNLLAETATMVELVDV